MILFHGTNMEFHSIELSKCKPYKDFGRGFYLTDIEEQAVAMAQRKCIFEGSGEPIVQKFEWVENLEELSILKFDRVSVDWADFIVRNRDRNQNWTHGYDLIIGPVADDGVVYQINRYFQGIIDLNTLVKELEYKKLNNQYCFCSEKAIIQLKKI